MYIPYILQNDCFIVFLIIRLIFDVITLISRAFFNNSILNCEMLIFVALRASRQNVLFIGTRQKKISLLLVQSQKSPFFPPPIEAGTGRAKRESRITCMRMLRTRPFSPQIGGKPIFGRTFQIRLVERFS